MWVIENLWSQADNEHAHRAFNWKLRHIHDGRLLIWPPVMRSFVIAKASEGDYFHRRARAAQVACLLALEFKKYGYLPLRASHSARQDSARTVGL